MIVKSISSALYDGTESTVYLLLSLNADKLLSSRSFCLYRISLFLF